MPSSKILGSVVGKSANEVKQSAFRARGMDHKKLQLILDLLKNRPDMDQVAIALYTGTNLAAVRKAARENGLQRTPGRKKKAANADLGLVL